MNKNRPTGGSNQTRPRPTWLKAARKMKNEMRLIRTIAIAAILTIQVGPSGARAENENGNLDVKALLKRIEELEQKVKVLEGKRAQDVVGELEQKVKVLERKGELVEEAAAEKGKAAPTVSIGENGLQMRSADTNFAVALHGVLQADNRTFFNDGNIRGNDGFLLRRAR